MENPHPLTDWWLGERDGGQKGPSILSHVEVCFTVLGSAWLWGSSLLGFSKPPAYPWLLQANQACHICSVMWP
jgi:hypothetical protein